MSLSNVAHQGLQFERDRVCPIWTGIDKRVVINNANTSCTIFYIFFTASNKNIWISVIKFEI